MSPMTVHTLRSALLLLVAFVLFLFSLVACEMNTGRSNIPTSMLSASGTQASVSPTPEFPPFTIGVWPSDMAPAIHESVTVYVICRIQDPTMISPARPAVGQQVRVNVLDATRHSYTATTNSAGIAVVHIAFSALRPGMPILVEAVTRWHDATYRGQTSFTPAPSYSPPPPPPTTPVPAPKPTPTATAAAPATTALLTQATP